MVRFPITALLLAGAVSAQNIISSAVLASGNAATAAPTRFQISPSVSLNDDQTTISVYAGGTATRGVTGVILGIDPCATTYEFYCTNARLCTYTDFTATLTLGPSSWQGALSTSLAGTAVEGVESCALSGTRAICVATATVSARGTSVVVVTTTATRASYIALPIAKTVSIPTGTCTLPQSEQYAPVPTTGRNGYTSILPAGGVVTRSTSVPVVVATTTTTNSNGVQVVNTVTNTIVTSTRSGMAPAVTAFVKGAVVPAAMAAVVALV